MTEKLNTPIQGTAADILKRALCLLAIVLKETGSNIIGTVHDEIIVEVPAENVEEFSKILKETMIKAGEEFLKKVPLEVDITIGDSW